MNSFYSQEEVRCLGFKCVGTNVLISRKVSFYGIESISIGNDVRIDDFCVLSGNISLGSQIHISAYCALYGSNGIFMEDNTGLSPRCTILSATDDFSGNYLIGPMSPEGTTHVYGGKVTIKQFSQIGASCVLFPSVTLEEGVVVGAMSLVNCSLPSWGVYAGIPA